MSSEVAKTGDDDVIIGKVRRLVRQVLLVWRVRSGMVMANRIDPVNTLWLTGSLMSLWAILGFGSDWPQYNLMGRGVAAGSIVLLHAFFIIINFMFGPTMAFVDRYIPRAIPEAPHDVTIERIADMMMNKADDQFEVDAGSDVRMAARNGLEFGKGMTDEMIDRITTECIATGPSSSPDDKSRTNYLVHRVIHAIVRQAFWTKWPPAPLPPQPKPTPDTGIRALAHVHEHDA